MGFVVEQLRVGGFDANFSYLGMDAASRQAFLVDPTGDLEVLRRAVAAHPGLEPRHLLVTHRHRDHIQQLDRVRAFFPAPVREFANLADRRRLPLGDAWIEAIFTPGHSPDSVCYRLSDDSGIFTGDTLFIDCIGYCEAAVMFRSLRILRALPDELIVYPGHDYGPVPTATLGEQKRDNPYLAATDFPAFARQLEAL